MSNRKVRDLPLYSGNTSGVYLIMNDAAQTTTHRVTKETLLGGYLTTSSFDGYATTGSNNFIGVETISGSLNITGSLNISGSQTLKVTGSLRVLGSSSFNGNHILSGSNTILGDTVMSGSIMVSGSQNFKGDQTITGALFISGSTVQIGNNDLKGNNTITGSNHILGNNTISGSNTIIGNTVLSGSIEVSGSFTGSMNIRGDVNVISGSGFYRWGNKLCDYANFYDTTTQSGSANTAYAISFNSVGPTDGFTIVSGSRVTATNTGVYNIRLAAKVQANENALCLFSFWMNYTGSINPNTLSQINIAKEVGGGSSLASIVQLVKMNAGDYFEMMYSKNTILGTLQYITGQTTPTRPDGPSARLLIEQVA